MRRNRSLAAIGEQNFLQCMYSSPYYEQQFSNSTWTPQRLSENFIFKWTLRQSFCVYSASSLTSAGVPIITELGELVPLRLRASHPNLYLKAIPGVVNYILIMPTKHQHFAPKKELLATFNPVPSLCKPPPHILLGN